MKFVEYLCTESGSRHRVYNIIIIIIIIIIIM